MKTTHSRIILSILLSASVGGCAALASANSPASSDNQKTQSSEISAEQEEKLHAIGGDVLIADARMIMKLDMSPKQGQYQARECLRTFLRAEKQQSEGDKSAKANFRSCVVMCESASKRSSDEVLLDFASRFAQTCQARHAMLAGASHLDRANKKLEDFKVAKGSVNQYYRDGEVRGAIRQAEEALGSEHPGLDATKRAYMTEYKSRESAIKRVGAFMNRPNIRAMRDRIGNLRAEVNALEKAAKYSQHARALLEQRKGELRAGESKYSQAMGAAKL